MFFFAVYIHILPRHVLRLLQGASRGAVDPRRRHLPADDGDGLHGYVLPWGQMSLWGAVVITNLFSTIPLVGETIVTWIWGGYAVDNPTLNRFFSLHYLLPFMIFGVVIHHVWALHVVGQNNPTGVEVKSLSKDTVPLHALRHGEGCLRALLLLHLLPVLRVLSAQPLGHADNYIMADALKTPANIVPEWYFLPVLNAILRSIPDKLGGVMAMGAAVIILAFLPWLDTSRIRSGAFPPRLPDLLLGLRRRDGASRLGRLAKHQRPRC